MACAITNSGCLKQKTNMSTVIVGNFDARATALLRRYPLLVKLCALVAGVMLVGGGAMYVYVSHKHNTNHVAVSGHTTPSSSEHQTAPQSSSTQTPNTSPNTQTAGGAAANTPATGGHTGSSGGSTGGSSGGTTGGNSGGNSGGGSGAPTQTLNCAPNPHLCGFPDATNTGVPAGTSLTLYNGDYTITTPGTVVSGLHITGALNINASNVTVKNSKIDCIGVGSPTGHDSCVILRSDHDTIQDSEVGGGASGTDFGNVGSIIYSGGDVETNLILRVNMHHGDDGLRLDGGTTVQDSYIHDLSDGIAGSHSDGSQSCQGSHMSFRHNTIWGGNNDAIFLQGGDCGSGANITDIVVDHNLLIAFYTPGNQSSFGIGVYRASNVTITNNQLSHTGWQVDAIGAPGPTDQITAYSGNIFDDDGTTIPHP